MLPVPIGAIAEADKGRMGLIFFCRCLNPAALRSTLEKNRSLRATFCQLHDAGREGEFEHRSYPRVIHQRPARGA